MKYEKASANVVIFPQDGFFMTGSNCNKWQYVPGIGNCDGYAPDAYDGSFTCLRYDDWQEWDIRDLGNDKYCKDYDD